LLEEYLELAHLNKHGIRPSEARSCLGKTRSLTGYKTEDDVKELFDESDIVAQKVKELAEIIRCSKHSVAYTGAGISTSAKIPDYRGPQGVWTLREKGLTPKMDVTLNQALPTLGHMALVSLKREGVLKFVVSTNIDGLRRRSGLRADECLNYMEILIRNYVQIVERSF
jgi:hypothetical protein